MEIYLAFDTETGGLSPVNNSLLTAYFAFCVKVSEDKFKIIDELDLALTDPVGYRVTQEALNINKINLKELQKTAITPAEAAKLLFQKLEKHTQNGNKKLTLIGQNIPFDEEFITLNLIPKTVWNKYVFQSDRLDTREILKKAKNQGKIPREQSLSLGAIANWLGVNVDQTKLHGAKYDTLVCIQVLEKAIRI
jgi:DNA polymerase III alpha subunit (gram-positive type)